MEITYQPGAFVTGTICSVMRAGAKVRLDGARTESFVPGSKFWPIWRECNGGDSPVGKSSTFVVREFDARRSNYVLELSRPNAPEPSRTVAAASSVVDVPFWTLVRMVILTFFPRLRPKGASWPPALSEISVPVPKAKACSNSTLPIKAG